MSCTIYFLIGKSQKNLIGSAKNILLPSLNPLPPNKDMMVTFSHRVVSVESLFELY